MQHNSVLQVNVTRIVALALAIGFYGYGRVSETPPNEAGHAAAQFRFETYSMPEAAHGPYKNLRAVHPSLQRISAWISTLGAAVALADLDGDGLSNDACRVEPRTDQVIIAPVPTSPVRYGPFVLQPEPLPYDSAVTAPMGCVTGDLNEDGLMDVLVYYWGRTPVAFLRKTGLPGQTLGLSASLYLPVDIVPTGERWYTNAAFLADLDGDGHLDIFIGNYFQDGGRILDAHASGREVMHDTKSKSANGGRDRLLRWEGASKAPSPNVQFRDVAGALEDAIARQWALAAGAVDLDGDMLPEIYIANDFGPDRLLHNRSTPGHFQFAITQGSRRFLTPASCVLGKDSFKGMGIDFGDVNGDGQFDIYVSNIAGEFALQEGHFLWVSTGETAAMKQGIAPYEDGAEALGVARSGWGWDARLADFNNDGVPEAVQATGFIKGRVDRWPELQALGTGNDGLMHNPRLWPSFRPGDDLSGNDLNAFFVRTAKGRYVDVGREIGFAQPMVSRGIAVGDVDGDGRLDFALANQYQASLFYHNKSAGTGAFLGLHLITPAESGSFLVRDGHPAADTPGWPAIGAIARVTLASGRKLVGQVDGGSGHSGKRSQEILLGLGDLPKDTPIPVALQWRARNGQARQQHVSLRPGWHTVVLGAGSGK